ncbi:TPA: hypothetical protein DF272_04400 [Candidatus Falkowbacteria bacterium]|nr:hypothetical protein [Candidatus Falkowbacteria bacterium]
MEIPSSGEKKERGKNTEVCFTFVRHSQKKSGNVFINGRISLSSLSEGGRQRAQEFGRKVLSGRSINRAYATEIDRTKETLQCALDGAGVGSLILRKKDGMAAFFDLPIPEISADANPKIGEKYVEIMNRRKAEYMAVRYSEQKFDELTPDQQEEIMEFAEEDSIEYLLSEGDEIDETGHRASEYDAAGVAFKVNRLINLPDFMPGGKAIDLVSSGHKTSTEAFLKYAVIQKNGKHGFDKLSEIGGSLKILDSWTLTVENDEAGRKKVSFILKREGGDDQKFDLDVAAIKELAKLHMEIKSIIPKKIDEI